MPSQRSLVRPWLRRLSPYVPGEQPWTPKLIKLNTNENPYPPAPGVIEAIRAAVDGRLRLYPDPSARALRDALARWHGCRPENVIAGNGSDELLALATRAFVEPAKAFGIKRSPRSTLQYFAPSYSLYPVLADIHGSYRSEIPLTKDFDLPSLRELDRSGRWDSKAALTLITTPNAPGGRGYATETLDRLCQAVRGVVLLDEAYADFAKQNALQLALQHSNVLVARTFSKGYSLCFQRVGYMIGPPELIGVLDRIRDSYNVNGLGQVAAIATLQNIEYYEANLHRIIARREQLGHHLRDLGFRVFSSEANFLLARPPSRPAGQWHDALLDSGIMVRWFDRPRVRAYLRISIGSEQEIHALLRCVKRLCARWKRA